MGTKKLAAIKPAQLKWRGQDPISLEYGDIYFSSQDGLAESEQIFLQGNQLADRWQHHSTPFVIAETGFGSGLNFLNACKLWFDLAGESAQLHYCAVEKNPLRCADLERIISAYAPLEDLLALWLPNYPPLVPGVHRMNLFSGRVHLTLAFMDVEDWLKTLNIRADAWFLDGFAPALNPAMWTESVLQGIALNTREGGSFATFTAASEVRKGLQRAGFKVEKVAGYGAKREALQGRLQATPETTHFDDQRLPWFTHKAAYSANKRATVIGAGLAGAFTADSLLRRGWQVTVIDRHAQPAREASGNRAGVIFSTLSAYDGPEHRFNQQAYLYAVMHLPQILAKQQIWSRCGMLQLTYDEHEQLRQQTLLNERLWPEEWLKGLDNEEASRLAGVPIQHSALYFPQAGWVSPAKACRYLIGCHPGIELVLNSEVVVLEFDSASSLWRARNTDGELLAESEVMIITAAHDALSLAQTRFLPLQRIRGQVSDVQQTAHSVDLRTVLYYDGYLTPSVGWQHSLGVTFDPIEADGRISEQDNERNIQALAECEPGVYRALCGEHGKPEVTDARVGFHCQTPDYLPVVGPLPDLEGLFVNVGHGTRGITTAPISAEIIASYLGNEPQPVDENVRAALHPARFMSKSP
ncbi:MAG: bifunctional tRNA (5-methylaminomethyl-2-thiouridine)(34)-methyltransferase MnmD/FAD-dependent 5-carboxymethylaminomethyl-2-thiouridine(34) oxidoreductase MnmC [Gammaproteobacteria bacterium]|nr:bifunctional tRNA (5-methylaminomethyl-2-thiouridine)(34)-methyltransferase MnmD/FAD-dependent 5-carboxymethylaminomethyl-2-thiouridine(34) oxidoreductase MnmC [Gammaproteobacteria bacterium]